MLLYMAGIPTWARGISFIASPPTCQLHPNRECGSFAMSLLQKKTRSQVILWYAHATFLGILHSALWLWGYNLRMWFEMVFLINASVVLQLIIVMLSQHETEGLQNCFSVKSLLSQCVRPGWSCPLCLLRTLPVCPSTVYKTSNHRPKLWNHSISSIQTNHKHCFI